MEPIFQKNLQFRDIWPRNHQILASRPKFENGWSIFFFFLVFISKVSTQLALSSWYQNRFEITIKSRLLGNFSKIALRVFLIFAGPVNVFTPFYLFFFFLQSNFIEITLRHGCSPLNLLQNFRKPSLKVLCYLGADAGGGFYFLF